jgi:membrane-bound metal-dependent hydrolase YbcI (DUF457 family)
MAGFDGHLRYGVAVYGLMLAVAGLGYVGGVVVAGTLALVVAALPLTLAGALFPDLDHPSSLSYRYGKRYLPLLFAAVALVVGLRYRGAVAETVAPRAAGTGAFLSGVVVASMAWAALTGTRWLLPRLRPPHRTVTHRLPAGLVAALCVGVFLALLTGEADPAGFDVELIGSGAFLAGFISHLAADDMLPAFRKRLLGSANEE